MINIDNALGSTWSVLHVLCKLFVKGKPVKTSGYMHEV